MAPVRSVAMPTLIGPAALAHLGRMTQLPIPVAIAPPAQAALCRSRRRFIMGAAPLYPFPLSMA
jgi:hypothetical protein